MSDKTNETRTIGEQLNKIIETKNFGDQNIQKTLGEGISKILNSSKEIRKFIDLYFSPLLPFQWQWALHSLAG